MLRGLMKFFLLSRLLGGGRRGGGRGRGGCGMGGLVLIILVVVIFFLFRSCSGGAPAYDF
ncbi:hypothetical protein FVR03_13410 [Pontibacter qinzhouensis]|uniref:Uncharacterized protein n=1 Tax=Pontibacter qinzhouensis TaxID=2603253 RepID=A0A5C8K256_9BACT|nr:hypothetical protein [Pontibacter qinzhouensis]TXK44635.1 hypothetical protein FVR03_13410 [Pontibacter qinzhouensis]